MAESPLSPLSPRGHHHVQDAPDADVDVSVIIVSWNVRELLRGCLESIRSTCRDLSLQIIVVDNASADGSVEMVRGVFPDVDVVASDSNLGFAVANNVGLARAQGRHVFFLNPDTVLRDQALTQLVVFLDRAPGFGMVGPRLVFPDGTVQRVCARRLPTVGMTLFEALYLHRVPFFGHRLNDRLISPYDLSDSREVEAISGAAMLARRPVVDGLEGFDESFLHTGEDIDLCLRLQQRGLRIFYLADAEVTHFAGQSSSLASVRAGTMSILSMGYYFRRSRGPLHAWIYRLIVQVIKMPLLLVVGAMKSLARRDGDELRDRVRFAKAVWRWRVSE